MFNDNLKNKLLKDPNGGLETMTDSFLYKRRKKVNVHMNPFRPLCADTCR
jgi:hypothetical protein